MWSWTPLSSAAVVEAMVGMSMKREVGMKWWEWVIGSGALKSMLPGLPLLRLSEVCVFVSYISCCVENTGS